jgi:phytoene dehydrogenase-like protein
MGAVVIGGGLAGLSAALTLQEAGEEVELFEASDGVGGRVRSDYKDGFILDRGFQLINAGYPEIKRLGVIPEVEFRRASRSVDVITQFGLTTIGDPRQHPLQALRSPLGSFREKLGVLTFLGEKAKAESSLEDALLACGTGDFYRNLLRPFLRGVFLANPDQVDSNYGREILKSFIVGDSGLPSAGVGTLSEAIAARIENIHLGAEVTDLAQFEGRKVIVATSDRVAARLLSTSEVSKHVDSYTWYHALPAGVITSDRLRVSSAQSVLVNSLAISNIVPEYAPADRTLISSTTLASLTEAQVLEEISKYWRIPEADFDLVERYEIKQSLPLFAPAKPSSARSSKVADRVFQAGDYMTAGSQNGALLSGRLAAMELLLDKS